eukprot:TRINITY_DN1820_c3_g1_i1.p2 TRINITY_DN1820_c3_g1~~TRINITY_DN1820_c3_g1_i1.p2  ORF type:complete len:185 (+),score=35.85 TRINITY_DN1820_c3_g1_i1:34-555(+)
MSDGGCCPRCDGRGFGPNDFNDSLCDARECSDCNGSGRVPGAPDEQSVGTCPDCDGRGWGANDRNDSLSDARDCSTCDGTGSASIMEKEKEKEEEKTKRPARVRARGANADWGWSPESESGEKKKKKKKKKRASDIHVPSGAVYVSKKHKKTKLSDEEFDRLLEGFNAGSKNN